MDENDENFAPPAKIIKKYIMSSPDLSDGVKAAPRKRSRWAIKVKKWWDKKVRGKKWYKKTEKRVKKIR